jgi:alkanesulfonate monooxygenase SsuD/methylene tetrahydromethanopterin reductase-like flavin-dependent oxidoreductase (luciferase family)
VHAACARAERDPDEVVFSLMTGFVIGEDAVDVRRHGAEVLRQENGGDDLEAFLASHADDWIVGTVEQAASRIAEYAEAGVERIYLQHLAHDDDRALELVARELVPLIASL